MEPKLTLHPDQPFRELLDKYAVGEPLTPAEVNFLARHEKALSNPLLDPALKYYLKHLHEGLIDAHSFLLPGELLNKISVDQFKRRLKLILLQKKNARPSIQFKMSAEEFEKFDNLAFKELIFYHGNQFLTGAPFIPGGLPQLIIFQWGNLFGVAKYVMLPDDKNLKSNVLVYFEDMQERDLDECVKTFVHDLTLEMKAEENKLKEQLKAAPVAEETPHESLIHTPRLTLELFKPHNEK